MSVHIIDSLLDGVADRTHRDDDFRGVLSSVVVEELVIGADLRIDLVHILFHNGGNRFIVGVGRFSRLEENVRILRGSAQNRVIGVEGSLAESLDGIHVQHIFQIVIIPHLNLLDLMGGTEPVEEVNEGDASFEAPDVPRRPDP